MPRAGPAVPTWPSANLNGGSQWCRAELARGRDTHTFTTASLSIGLMIAGSPDEAMAAANGLIDAAEATRNPHALWYALFAYGFVFQDANPARALDALRRGLVIAQDSRNRAGESALAQTLSRIEAEHGDPVAALDHLTIAIRNYHDSGNTTMIRSPLAILARLFEWLGRYEPAATIAGFAFSPLTAACRPRTQHRDHPPPRCPRRPDLRIARPQGRAIQGQFGGDTTLGQFGDADKLVASMRSLGDLMQRIFGNLSADFDGWTR